MAGTKIVFVEKPDGKKPPGRSRSKWEDITTYVTQMGLEGVARIHWFRIGNSGSILCTG
jgi:hypothetical protein